MELNQIGSARPEVRGTAEHCTALLVKYAREYYFQLPMF